eukprot:TRINITY_DN6768_c0_g1_i1.p1 TRINITY_DN6768_c0_g1~~TRINITY_DN6768_c0_g1_i1.p1  ORF type:complete len:161 (-),score=41.67 TRINITY_DN6768_c0_g1_i1:32-514(-)
MAWFKFSAWGFLAILLYLGLFMLSLLVIPVPLHFEKRINDIRLRIVGAVCGFNVCRICGRTKIVVRFADFMVVVCLILSFVEVVGMRKLEKRTAQMHMEAGDVYNHMKQFREQRNFWLSVLSVVVYVMISRYSALLMRLEEKTKALEQALNQQQQQKKID